VPRTSPSSNVASSPRGAGEEEPRDRYYHRELGERVKHFTSLFKPEVPIFMDEVVGFVAVALISAMYGIYSQVKI
jgi:hypothetical protein